MTLIVSLQPIKDWLLFVIVAVLIAVDLVFLIIVTPVWRLKLTRRLLPRQVSHSDRYVLLSPT